MTEPFYKEESIGLGPSATDRVGKLKSIERRIVLWQVCMIEGHMVFLYFFITKIVIAGLFQ